MADLLTDDDLELEEQRKRAFSLSSASTDKSNGEPCVSIIFTIVESPKLAFVMRTMSWFVSACVGTAAEFC
jgi:hypothetical protein